MNNAANENNVETTGKKGMVQLEIKAVVNGKATVVAVLTCLDSVVGRRGALHLADNVHTLFASDATGSPPCKDLVVENSAA